MAKQTQMQHPYELFAYEVGQDMKALENRVVALENKPAPTMPKVEVPNTPSQATAPQSTIATFVFNVKAELSPEDKAKVEAGTHEPNDIIQNPIDIVLALGKQYANKHYIAFAPLGSRMANGIVNSEGNIPMEKLDDMDAHQILVQVFTNPTISKVPAYLSVSEKKQSY